MCLIYQRDGGEVLDKEKFKTAVENNPHGWGLAVPNGDGLLTVHKSITTDADELYDLIHGEYAEDDIMLHLRYTTAGETVLRNAHPFPILEYDTDGVDLRMCHNGTLYSYKPAHNANNKWESDTRVFVREFVRPLAKRFIHQYGKEEITKGHMLNDDFFYTLLDSELSKLSVLSFLDGHGNTLQVNATGNGGKYEEGVWFSNVYSFDSEHRKPKKVYGTGGTTSGSHGTTGSKTSRPSNSTSFSSSLGNTEKFTDKHEIDEDDLFTISDWTIELLVDEEPEDAELLIKELLYLLKKSKDNEKELGKEVDRVKRKHDKASKLIETLKKDTDNDKAA